MTETQDKAWEKDFVWCGVGQLHSSWEQGWYKIPRGRCPVGLCQWKGQAEIRKGESALPSLSGLAHVRPFCFSLVLGIPITLVILNANGIITVPCFLSSTGSPLLTV